MNFNRVLKNIAIGGLFFVPLVPLVVADGHSLTSFFFPSMLFPFITGKGFFFRIIIEIVFSAWIILALRDSTFRPKSSLILWTLGIFLAVIALADIFSVNPFKSFWSNFERMEGLIAHIHLFLYFIVASSMLSTWKLWNWFLHTNVAVGLFLTFYSFFQLGGGLVINQGGVRVDGTLGNSAYLALYLLFSVFLLLFLFYTNQKNPREILYTYAFGSIGFLLFYLQHISQSAVSISRVGVALALLSLILGAGSFYLLAINKREPLPKYVGIVFYAVLLVAELFILYFTATRGAILGLGIGVTSMFVMFVFFEKKNKMLKKWSMVSIACIVLLGASFFIYKDADFIKQSPVLARFSSLFSYDVKTFLTSGEGKTRYYNALAVLQGMKERPLLGWGQESFNYTFYKYYSPKMYDQEAWFDRAHNVIFDWLVAGGIFGLLAYLSILVSAFYYLLKRRKSDDDPLSSVSRIIIAGLLIAYFLQNLTVFDNITSYIFFFTILAYLHFSNGKEFPDAKKAKEESSGISNTIMPPLVAVLLIASLYFFNLKGILAGTNLIYAISPQEQGLEKNIDYFKKALSYSTVGTGEVREFIGQVAAQVDASSVDQKIKEQFAELAQSEFDKQLASTPLDARYYYLAGIAVGRTQGYAEELPYIIKASELSPKKQLILMELGLTYGNLGKFQESFSAFKTAYELEPSFEDAKIMYALSSLYVKNEALTKELIGEKYEETVATDTRFIPAFLASSHADILVSIFRKKIEENPKEIQYRISLSATLLKMGNKTGSISELQKAIAVFPEFKKQGEQLIQQIREGKKIESL